MVGSRVEVNGAHERVGAGLAAMFMQGASPLGRRLIGRFVERVWEM